MSNPLAANPAYLAFLREMGIDDAESASDATTSTEDIGRQLAMRLPRLADEGERAREDVSGSFEGRGLFRSGAHEVALARQRADEGHAVGELLGDGADRIAGLQAELARRRLAAVRRRADSALSFAPDAFLDGAV